jgi:cell division septal protein FtsQ
MSDYAARSPASPSSAARGRRRLRIRTRDGEDRSLVGLLVAVAMLVLAATALLFVPPALRITRYEVSGNASMSREQVLSAALIHEKEYFLSLDCSRVEAALEAQPRVASAAVSKLFPNGLRIALTERTPVASALVDVGGRAQAVYIDREGVAYAVASQDDAASVPVLSGLRFEGFREGTRLPRSLAALTASLGEIRASEPALLAAISEIRVVAPYGADPNGPPELLVYPLKQRVPVRASASLDASTLRSIILVLDVLGTRGIADSVSEIDFRTGSVVYRGKEGHSD